MRKKGTSLKKRLYTLLLICLAPLMCMAVYLIWQMRNYARHYDDIVEKITAISDYNINFKEEMDSTMYIVVVNAERADTLVSRNKPFEMIEEARASFEKLYEEETLESGRTYLSRILTCLNSLQDRVQDIEDDALVSGNYDLNMERLELNIYILTELIQEQIQKYIYYETQSLDELSSSVNSNMQLTMNLSMAMIVVIVLFALAISRRIMSEITEPINAICADMKRVGAGDFAISGNEYEYSGDEIATLHKGFNQMLEHIGRLVDDIREEQNNLRVMEVGLLQAQINPHFLYNTLDTITWLAETGENGKVVEMVDNLSTFFRLSLSRGEDIISLQEEMRHTRSYLEIQKVRYGDILNYEMDIPEEIYAHRIPKLTLQPIVENSIYHGIKNKRGRGMIEIYGCLREKCVELTVQDNGIGMTKERLESLRTAIREEKKTEGADSGFGIYNVNLRLKLYYGEDYKLQVESVYGQGTEVIISLPLYGLEEES